MTIVAVVVAAVAGGLAAVLRWGIALAFTERSLPWAVLVANVSACGVAGVGLGLADAGAFDDSIRLVLLSGIAGGLSTFSTWSVETIQLVQQGRWPVALGSVAANLLLGIAAVTAGSIAAGSIAAWSIAAWSITAGALG